MDWGPRDSVVKGGIKNKSATTCKIKKITSMCKLQKYEIFVTAKPMFLQFKILMIYVFSMFYI